MARPPALELTRDAEVLRAVMPAGRNPLYYAGALLFGVPWLVTIVVGIVLVVRAVPAMNAGLVWAAALLGTLALTALLDVLALALVWLSLYSLFGAETLEVTASQIRVRRRAAWVTMRAHAKRGHFDRATELDPRRTPGRVPHPRVEISGAYSRLRVGAGLSPAEAARLVEAVGSFLREHGPQKVS